MKKDFDDDMIDISDDYEDKTESLSFDKEVSDQIDEMLDFASTTVHERSKEEKAEFDKLVNESSNDKKNKRTKLKPEKKLEVYVPSKADFNIKNAKTRKIVEQVFVCTIILMLISFEFLVEKAGSALKSLRIYAANDQPIKIVQNDKYGYIDSYGEKIINPKYTYAENFIKGYAIVKNSTDLPMIIDRGGKAVVQTGVYFSVYRASNDIIASKVTKKGLKYGILDANISTKTPFIYDSITAFDGGYTYVKGNSVGLINSSGKDIYNYKLTDADDLVITVKPSKVTNINYVRYGVVTVNGSSFIVNLTDGKVASSATLNKVVPEENNVFYELSKDGSKTYKYVQNNKVVLETDNASNMSVKSIETGVIKVVTKDFNYEFVSVKTSNKVAKDLNDTNTYYGDKVFIYKTHNYKTNSDEFNLVKDGAVYKTISGFVSIENPFDNGLSVVKFSDGKFGYINENGDLINSDHYDAANLPDTYGDALVKKNGLYGVVNVSGKLVLKTIYKDIKMSSGHVKKISKSNHKNVFYAVKEDNKYILYNSSVRKISKEFYDDVTFDENYPVIKASTETEDLIITTENMKKIVLTSSNTDYEVHENYVIIKDNYYNYDGKLIYVDHNSK